MTLRGRLSSSALLLALSGATAFAAVGVGVVNVEVDFSKRATLTSQEMVAQAKEYRRQMVETQKRVLYLQTKAKKDKDIVKLLCVEDKLAGLRGHVAVGELTMNTLDSAVQHNDEEGRAHMFTRLTILHQKVIVLGNEAEQCIGEDINYVGATRVDLEVDPGVPPDDPTVPQLPIPEVDRPPEASPFV